MIITNKLEECIFSVPSPFDEDKSIDLSMELGKNTKCNVEFVNGSPYIKIDINLSAKILSVNKHTSNFDEQDLKLIESYAESYVKEKIDKYLYKTSKNFHSDIAMFGRYAVSHFSTWDRWIKYNWLDNYKNAFFDTKINVDVTSSYLIS